jgi:hypothetical protein
MSDWRNGVAGGRLSLALGVLLSATALAGAQPAVAGTYVMRNCSVPGYADATIGPWRAVAAPGMSMVDGCSAGRGLRFTLPETRIMGVPTTASLDLALSASDASHAIEIERVRAWTRTRISTTSVSVLDAGVQVLGSDSGVPVAYLSDGSDRAGPPVVASFPEHIPGVQIVLMCRSPDRGVRVDATGGPGCYADDPVPVEVGGLEVTLREDAPPQGSVTGGTLVSNLPVSAVRSLDYSATDGQSGLARIEALVDGTVVGVRDLAGRCAYADLAACPTQDRDTMSIDTRAVPDGHHALALRVIDAAGNRSDIPAQGIDVQNQALATPGGLTPGSASQGPAIGLAAAAATDLTAAFASSSRSSLVVPLGRRVTIRGRLTTASRAGVSGAAVSVLERSAVAGAEEVPVGSAMTRSDGMFEYELAAGRPSRTVRLAYGSLLAPQLLNLRVRAASTLTASLRGTTIRFSGRVLSRPLPDKGKLVQLQGKAPGFAWTKFAYLRTDRRGRFSGRYRLQAHRPGVRVQIRVLVPTARGYPYLSFSGRPVTLRVR